VQGPELREDDIYLFQFPSPFPHFTPPGMEGEAPSPLTEPATTAKPEAGLKPDPKVQENIPEIKVDGIIGELVVYRSGAVKMKLGDGILMDVNHCLISHFEHLS
jgi:DNA-directed RNA polymerase III subunit RPC4